MAAIQQFSETGRNGFAAILDGAAAMGRKTQEIAGEFLKISQENLGAGNRAIERLRDARSLQDVTAIQTDLLKESFETMNAHYRRIAEIAVSAPGELAGNCNAFISAVADTGAQATQRAADVTRTATEKGVAAFQRTADTMRDASHQVTEATREAVNS